MFVKPGDDVYEGMVVGENNRDNDLVINVTRAKQLTNVRASGKDETVVLTPPKKITLEAAIDFIEDDEAPPPDDTATYNLLREHLSEVLNGLPPREVRILQLRYGLLDGQAYTLEEVGRKMGVTR